VPTCAEASAGWHSESPSDFGDETKYPSRTHFAGSALERDASRRCRSAMAHSRLRVALSQAPSKHQTPNFAELSAFGDQRFAMQVFFDRPNGRPSSTSLCSDAAPEEHVLPNAFGAGRFSLKRAPPKVDRLR